MYEIRLTSTKGFGVFAKSQIPRGTRIFSERPLLGILQNQDSSDIYNTARFLSVQDRLHLLALSAHSTKELSILRWSQAIRYTVSRISSEVYGSLWGRGRGRRRKGKEGLQRRSKNSIFDHVKILHIFRSNAFNLGLNSPFAQAVFPYISRLNHSCLPNAQGNFHKELGTFNIHATRDIQVDEELTLNYLSEHGGIREFRQKKLLSGYGFECACPACNLETIEAKKGEEGRVVVGREIEIYAEGVAQGQAESNEQELTLVESLIGVLERDGIAGREVSSL
jgi:hypothetical protein